MTKALIIDDEPLARSIIIEYLHDYADISVVSECNDGFEGIKAIQEHQPQLIFLDIQMPKINGFEMLELVESPPSVIFTTAFDQYAFRAFEAHALDYLLKPFSKERFAAAMAKWRSQLPGEVPPYPAATAEQQQRIVVRHGNSIRIIPIEEIIFLEAYDDYVKIHTKDGVF